MKLPQAFLGDPVDRLIASTARVEDLTLLTHDSDLIWFGNEGLFRALKVNRNRSTHA